MRSFALVEPEPARMSLTLDPYSTECWAEASQLMFKGPTKDVSTEFPPVAFAPKKPVFQAAI
jgi:hypothetical protein